MRKLLFPLAFLAAVLIGLVVASGPGDTSTEASGCRPGYHLTYSKYAGTYCQKNASRGTKAVASVVGGCVVGVFGLTPASIVGGCGAGVVGAITGSL